VNEILTIDVSTTQARALLYQRLQTDAALRSEARRLSVSVLGQKTGSCIDCVIDAIIQLQLKYKQNGKIIMESKQYAIRAGAVINDITTFDAGKVLTAANCTEELALYHLAANPACRKYFSKLPENIDERIEQYITRNAAPNAEQDVEQDAKQNAAPNVEPNAEPNAAQGASNAPAKPTGAKYPNFNKKRRK
jgi:hypothetical protein